jgi:acyl-coenzyme A synthetase/AMP-(fatty) acid ligase
MGYRIELPEIEYQVLAIEQIANACVLYNKGKKEIALFYQTRDGTDLSPAAIRQALAQIFPKYMLPTAFHQMKELPRNPNGKIDRNGLSVALEQMA